MRVLLGTNHLERLSGSETVLYEFAEYLEGLGCDLTVFANWTAKPMVRRFLKRGLAVVTDPLTVRPFEYDLCYFQHQIAGLFDYQTHHNDRVSTTIAIGRLSPNGLMESGGWAHDEVLADVVLANSAETERALRVAGTTTAIEVFHNAAPTSFHRTRRRLVHERPERILVVTNHRDPHTMAAVERLRSIVEVEHIGRSGDRTTPITPKMIANVDVVVSIGKTVQYALASRTPVFVYDRFGGPGYLNANNFSNAEYYNFSGRCTPVRMTSDDIVNRVLSDYPKARMFYAALDESVIGRYRLPTYIDKLVNREPRSNADRRASFIVRMPEVERERLVSTYVRSSYIRRQRDTKMRTEAKALNVVL